MLLYVFYVLAAPAKILKAIREIQRAAGPKKEKKWALVAWDKFYLPKSLGGLGIKYLQITSKTMAGNLWWSWVKS